jgi:hypothetical protein
VNGQRDVAIGYCRGDTVDGAFADCLAALVAYDGIEGSGHLGARIVEISGPRIAAARNNVCRRFLELDMPWLLMLDTDMTFQEDLLDRIVARATIVDSQLFGALCFAGGRGGLHVPNYGFVSRDDHGHLLFDYPLALPEHADMVHADVVGAAALLIHRDILRSVYAAWCHKTVHAWFEESQQKPCDGCGFEGSQLGEDVVFSLRATAAGYPITVDLGLEVGHRRSTVLDKASFYRQGHDLATFGEEALLSSERRRIGLSG